MKQAVSRSVLFAAAASLALAGCTVPRTGPFSSTITGADETLGMRVVEVTGPQAIPSDAPRNFSESLRGAGPLDSYALGQGDALQIQVWEESVTPGADGTVGTASISLPRAEIDERGEIFVPFAGRIRAAGRTLSELHEALTEALAAKLVNPQVSVSRIGNESAVVNVIGAVGSSGPVPLGVGNQRLLDVLTRAGGPSEDPDVTRVTLMRGGLSETLWLGDVYTDRANDIAMRAGDTLLLERDKRTFTVMGAVNKQTSVEFPARRVSALRALAEASGLNDRLADPTGVFVFRPGAGEATVYLLDLNRADGMLLASAFDIADGDMVYVTNAPITTWLKIISAISPTIGLAGSVTTVSGN